MSHHKLVIQAEIARWVAHHIESSADKDSLGQLGNQSTTVMLIFTTVGKFLSFMFRKTHYETVIAEIYGLGTFMRNCTVGHLGDTDFYPSFMMQQETRFVKQYPSSVKEPAQKQELTLSRIAQVCSISEDLARKLLNAICKAIVRHSHPKLAL